MFRSFICRIVRHSAIVSVACLACMLVAATASHAQGLYQAQSPNLNTATTPAGTAAADFALSGFRSLAVTVSRNAGGTHINDVEVYLATGANTFANGVTYATCTGPTAVLAQDLNADGYPDLVVACPGADTVDVLLNRGSANPGTFSSATAYSVSNDPVAMVAGDFTGNGQTDIAVISGTGNGITALLNNNGTFTKKTSTAAGTLSGVTAGDFNHDGHLDIAVSDSGSNNIHVLNGTGTGTFGAEANFSAGARTNGIQAADFNHDGNPDLAITTTGNNAGIFLGNTAGTFTFQGSQAAGTGVVGLSVTDVNSDGNPDVVAFDSATTSQIAVLLGNGNGTLQAAQFSTLTAAPSALSTVDDFNRDGKPDLAVTQSSNQVSVLLNNTLPTQYPAVGNPDGRSFAAANQSVNGYGNMADSVAVGDFNQDGRPDVAVTYLEDNVVRVLLNNNNPAGTFNAATAYAVGKQPYWVASGDLNGDGYPDLVVTNTTDNTISVLLNNGKSGNGTFAAAATYTVGKSPFQVAIGDVNGDGIPDLAVTNFGDGTVSVLFGHAGGTFTAASTLTVGTGTGPYGVAIGDFAHNGFPGIAVTSNLTSQLYVFPNNGNGTFGSAPFIATTDTAPGTLVVGDFNRDGILDIVTGNTTANDVSFFAGNGNSTFAAGMTSPSLNFPNTIAAGDVNGDGILDIVGVSPNFNDVEVTLGNGNGLFGTFLQRAAGIFPAAKQPWGVALTDFNNDGQLDIVTANAFYLLNIASPSSQARYMTQYPAIPAGNPSIDVLYNTSAANISVASNPASPLPYNNTGTTVTAAVSPAFSGATPTGSVIFEDATGSAVGSGPYDLSGGVATYNVGHLGSGQYLFTSLYSGDANFQPTTVSGSLSAVTVTGTPVTLSLNPSTVDYGSNFTATVTVIGNAATGSFPQGNATIFAVSAGGTTVTLGTTNTLQRIGGGNTSSRTISIPATTPNLNIGTYQLYAIYNPSNGTYPRGSSSYESLTVTSISTSLTNTCLGIFFINGCEATVAPAAAAGSVTFSINGGAPTTEALNGGNALFAHDFTSGGPATYTVLATYMPSNPTYTGSSATATVTCENVIIFGTVCFGNGSGSSALARSLPLNSFTGFLLNAVSGRSARGQNNTQFSPFRLF